MASERNDQQGVTTATHRGDGGLPPNKGASDMGATERVVLAYEQYLRSWASTTTTVSRTVMARRCLLAWGIDGFTTNNIEKLLGDQANGWTRSTYHANLTCFCGWLVTGGLLTTNPMTEVHKPRRPRSRPRPLTDRQVDAVLSVAKGRTRDWIMFALLAGLRAHEIAKLRGEDIDSTGIYVEGKGGKKDVLPCHPDLWAIAQTYPPDGFMWPGKSKGTSISRAHLTSTVSELFDLVGVEGSVHRCRHTFGTRLLRAGVNIRTVQRLLRHESLATTQLYTAVDEEELLSAVLLMPALAKPAA